MYATVDDPNDEKPHRYDKDIDTFAAAAAAGYTPRGRMN